MYIDNDRFKGRCKDLRKGRYSENGRIYLVTTVTCQREKVFSNFYLGRIVVRSMLQQEQQDRVNNLAFVVMPDHLHWLLCLKNDWTIAKVMQNVKGSSAFLIQKFLREQYGADVSRSLWQAGYYDHALRKE